MSPKVSLLSLPTELLCMVASNLNVPDLLSLSTTNSTLNAFIHANESHLVRKIIPFRYPLINAVLFDANQEAAVHSLCSELDSDLLCLNDDNPTHHSNRPHLTPLSNILDRLNSRGTFGPVSPHTNLAHQRSSLLSRATDRPLRRLTFLATAVRLLTLELNATSARISYRSNLDLPAAAAHLDRSLADVAAVHDDSALRRSAYFRGRRSRVARVARALDAESWGALQAREVAQLWFGRGAGVARMVRGLAKVEEHRVGDLERFRVREAWGMRVGEVSGVRAFVGMLFVGYVGVGLVLGL